MEIQITLVDLNGLTREERIMVQASISNARDFDIVVEALIIQHPRIHLRENQRRTKGKGKDGFKRVDNPNSRWSSEKGKGKHTGSGKSGTSAHHANLTSVVDYDYYCDEDLDESANAYQDHNDPVDPGSDDGEEAPDYDDEDEENDTFSSCVALDDVSVFEAAELDAIALLADAWNDDLDPEASAQLVQASAQAYLSFEKDKGKGQVPSSTITSVVGGPTTTPERTKSEDRVSSLWSKGTLGERPQMRQVFLQFVYTKSNTYSSYGDSNLPTERIKLERVLFLTNTAMDNTYLFREKRPSRYLDSDSFRRSRHEEHSHFRRSCRGRNKLYL